nr:hypothetical protein [Tanacetum cinerariifolium]
VPPIGTAAASNTVVIYLARTVTPIRLHPPKFFLLSGINLMEGVSGLGSTIKLIWACHMNIMM